MQANLGTIDRVIRLIAGAVVLSLAFFGPRTPFGYLGLVLIVTAGISFCPIYAALGLRTNKPAG